MENCSIQILGKKGDKWIVQEPVVTEAITWRTKRKGEPASLEFTCVKDEGLSFQEGSEVKFYYGKSEVFSGYVFEKSRNKDQHINVVCYDRTRYLKNKYSSIFTNLRADEIVKRIAMDLQLKLGDISNTRYVIPKFAQSDVTFFDMIVNALSLTTHATGITYTLYDDFGKICLKSLDEMTTNYLLDVDVAEDFNYTSSIDRDTYNAVLVRVEGEEPVFEYDRRGENSTLRSWGFLQYETDSTTKELARQKAQALLKAHNNVSCSFGVNGALGDVNVRAGSGIFIDMALGDDHGNFKAKMENNKMYYRKMLVDEATHTFENGHHSMDLTLMDGGKFYG